MGKLWTTGNHMNMDNNGQLFLRFMWALSVFCLFVIPVQCQCPAIIGNKSLSVDCFKNQSTLEVTYTSLTQTFAQFSGLHVSVNRNNPDALPATIDGDRLIYNHIKYQDATVKVTDTLTTVSTNHSVEMVWPLRPDGASYSWTATTECRFQNRQTLHSTRSLKVDSSNDVTLPEVTASLSEDKPVPLDQIVSFSLQIPVATTAAPVHCGITTDPTAVSHPSNALLRANVCLFWSNGLEMAPTTPCVINDRNPVDFTINRTKSTDDTIRILTASWKAFRPSTDLKDITAFCVVKMCALPSDAGCAFNTGNLNSPISQAVVEEHQWLSIIRKEMTVEAATTPRPETNTTEPTPGNNDGARSLEEFVCMTPAEMGALFGVPLALILVFICTLLYLVLLRQRQVKRSFEDAHPIITLDEEPVVFRRPQIIRPGLDTMKTSSG